MAKKIKISRKQIKQPDEFITWSEMILEWSEKHVWEMMGALAGVIIILLLAQGIRIWWRGRDQGPSNALSSSLRILKKTVSSDQVLIPGLDDSYASEEDKYQAAADSFLSVIKDYPGSPEARVATIYLARAYEKLGDFDQAINYYQQFLGGNAEGQNPELGFSAIMGKARCFYQKGEYEQAVELYDQIIESDSVLRPDAMLEQARAYTRLGNIDKLSELLENLKNEYPDQWLSQPSEFLASQWKQRAAEEKEKQIQQDKSLEVTGESSMEPGTDWETIK